MGKKLISVVIPAYNEQDNIDELGRRLGQLFDEESGYDWEAIIVENGSVDDTFAKAMALNARDPRFKVLQLSRNFRMDGGLTAGLNYATGDAAVVMAGDLQDEPEVIPSFLREWEDGFVRGLFAWVGFRNTGVEAPRAPREAGVSGAHTLKVLDLAMKGIFAHSYVPLKFIFAFGLIMSVLSFLALIVMIIVFVAFGVPFAGFGTIISVIVLLFGILFTMLGLVAEYVGLIYEEVKQRPNFVVREGHGFDGDRTAD
ncbi:MAG: glycosyltransferase [Thermoleophilia bacterium]